MKWYWKRVLVVYKIAECEPTDTTATAAEDDSFEEDHNYTDCRLKNLNNEYMTDKQTEELSAEQWRRLQWLPLNTWPESDFLIINSPFQDQQIYSWKNNQLVFHFISSLSRFCFCIFYGPGLFCQCSVLFYSITLHMQITQGNKLAQDFFL